MDSWGDNLHYTQDEKGVYKCPACGEEAYYDSDYGQQLFVFCPWCGHDTKQYDDTMFALDMAIKALEQESCEDAISRQATVERLCKVAEFMNEKREGLGSPYIMAALFIQDNKDEFPPVTPYPKTGHWITEDMFDGDVAYRCSVCGELFWLESGTPKDNEYNFAQIVEQRCRR